MYIVCLVGPSGSGKTTIAYELEKQLGIKSIESFTTRPQRYEGEKGHIFSTERIYKLDRERNNIAAETYFNGQFYWTTKDQLEDDCLYVIDPVGIRYLKENCKDKNIIVIYLDCNKQNRYIRMRGRGDSHDTALERLEHDGEAFNNVESDYMVNANKPLKKVLADIIRILKERGIINADKRKL